MQKITLKRYAFIDALRGIAILGVLIAHAGLHSNIAYPLWFKNLTEIYVGPRGVQLFYLVSAFTLCLSFDRRRITEKHALKNFYIRRLFRIAPLFYLSILYYLWQQGYWTSIPRNFSFLNILTTVTFTNGFAPAWINNIVFGSWSIAIESTFYLLFPFLYFALKTKRVALITTFFAMIVMQILRLYILALPYAQQHPDFQTYTFQFFPSQFPIFLIGITLFLIMREKITQKTKKTITKIALFIGILLIAQSFFPIKIIAGHYIYGLFFGLLLYILAKHPYKIFVNPVTVYIGKISFSLYLCHIGCYYWLNNLGLNNHLPTNPYLNYSLRFLILFIISSIIASILYATIEKGGIWLGRKLINRSEEAKLLSIPSTSW